MRFIKLHRVTSIAVLLSMFHALFAQTPTHYPTGEHKVDFTFINILIYIVFPVLLVFIWIVIRRRKPGEKSEK